jgi:hypothetical protein
VKRRQEATTTAEAVGEAGSTAIQFLSLKRVASLSRPRRCLVPGTGRPARSRRDRTIALGSPGASGSKASADV